MRFLLRQHCRFFLAFTGVALALRLLFVLRFSLITDDGFIYGDIAKNWLTRGVFGMGANAAPTLVRLPGYPAILAAVWSIFGLENYNAVLAAQVVAEIATCFLVADLTRRCVSDRAAMAAFALAALCPFTANYTAAPLTESFAIFFAALTLDLAITGLARIRSDRLYRLVWTLCGLALACGVLLRADGGILLAATGLYLVWRFFFDAGHRLRYFTAAALMSAAALAPLVPWTIRNYAVFHVFEPVAPRYANMPGEFVPHGFDRWVKTWMADYDSVEEFYWNEGDAPMEIEKLPERAFDSFEEHQQTANLLAQYNANTTITPEIDAQFAALAEVRIARNPLRYYAFLPLTRIADMWLRPRTELLGIESRWWDWENDPNDSMRAMALGSINLAYIAAALVGLGLVLRKRVPIRALGLMLLFVVLRSAFLSSLENPEPRYTLECFPVVMVLAAVWVQRLSLLPATKVLLPIASWIRHRIPQTLA